MQRANKLEPDVAKLDKMAAMLRHAHEEVEDIFDDAKQRIVSGDILYGAVQTCIGCFNRSCLGITLQALSRADRLGYCNGHKASPPCFSGSDA